MFLKKIELQGFKSFADKTILEFMPGITTVIGPNGSGKSNISDAIKWVLGEQSIKSLRGTKSEDIIFAGTQSRKSLGFAEASIVIDNSDSSLPIEFLEVVVTRRIYRSGESGYFINKTPCRLKDILELFMDTGIGKEGYSIIGQGKIDEILSNKSEDKRHIFEEAAGIVKYRARKEETEKKLEQTKVNLLRINDILSEIEVNIEPLKQQSEKAKKFLDLREELKSIEIGLFLFNIDNYKQKLEEIIKDIDIIASQNTLEENRLTEMQLLKENLKIEIDNLSNKIEETQNLSFESTNKIEKINSDINLAKQKIAGNNDNFARYLKEINELNERIKSLEEEKIQKSDKKDSLFSNKEKFMKELEEKEKELQEITKKLTGKEMEIELKKKKVEENTELKYEKNSDINTQNINFENFDKRQTSVKNEIATVISELDNNRMNKEEISKKFYEIDNKRNKSSKQLAAISSKREETLQQINKYESEINNVLSELRIKESKLKFLVETEKEKEGYNKSVKSLLLDCENNDSLNKGVHGVLANLINVDKEYQTAIEMALGMALQNIVTENEEDAKKLVEHLRKNNLGRASFLPISSVKGKKIEKLIKNNLGGVVGVASDLVQTDKIYEGIILNLLGRTVIVNDMDTGIVLARQNGYGFRIVTLKGDIINPSGAITGGSVTQKSFNILGRTTQIADLENETQKLNKEVIKLKQEKENFEKSQENVLEETMSLEKEIQDTEIIYATEKQKLLSIEENIVKLQERLEKLKQEQIDLLNKKDETQLIKKSRAEEILLLEKEIENLNVDISIFVELNKDNQKYIDDLNFDITNLKISVSSFDESETSINEIVARIENDILKNNEAIKLKNEQREIINKENSTLENQILEYNNEKSKIENDVLTSGEKTESLKQERINKNEKLNKIDEDIINQFKVIETVKQQLSKIEVKKTKIDVELDQIVNKMWEDYEITPNNATEYKKPENVAQTTKKVNSLRTEIKDLGSINIDSIEEYKETSKRYDFMCEQRLDLENSSAKLKKVIQEMTAIMKEQFSRQFNLINKNFGEIFKELFGGGNATIKLTDEEDLLNCGIDIEAEPPGKKLQNMSLLSGGEKALTAIALLFAILKINPAPFCVLDEIEAALDDVNVYRFAEYLKKFDKTTQFLVITHRKGTMEVANMVYGVTMEENGISKLLSMKLNHT